MTSTTTSSERRRPLVLQWRTAVFNSEESSSTKLTLLALAEHADLHGRNCYPSVETLAEQTSLGEKTCRRALDAAAGRWFDRTPMKFTGRDWRGYSYQLLIPKGAVTVTGARRQGAVTVTGSRDPSCGHSKREVRSLATRGAVTVTDDLGRAPRKSTKGEEPPADAGPPRDRVVRAMTYKQWAESKHEDDEMLIPKSDPIFDYADEIRMPFDFLRLHWLTFSDRYREDPKHYPDWRAVFRDSVHANWYRLWYIDDVGDFRLTTQGKQADRLHQTGIETGGSGDSGRLQRLRA